jgi:hypothetical protein
MDEYRLTPAVIAISTQFLEIYLQRWDVEQTNRYIDILTATLLN